MDNVPHSRAIVPFNGLTPSQAERLAILAEEANELAQAAMKILRHGYESVNPDKPEDGTNRFQLEREFAQVQGTFHAMKDRGDVRIPGVHVAMRAWEAKLRYCHHQGDPR